MNRSDFLKRASSSGTGIYPLLSLSRLKLKWLTNSETCILIGNGYITEVNNFYDQGNS